MRVNKDFYSKVNQRIQLLKELKNLEQEIMNCVTDVKEQMLLDYAECEKDNVSDYSIEEFLGLHMNSVDIIIEHLKENN